MHKELEQNILKEQTHIVLKIEDIQMYLCDTEIQALQDLMGKIADGRKNDGKTAINEYYVVNKDEPYSKKIRDYILFNECVKNMEENK